MVPIYRRLLLKFPRLVAALAPVLFNPTKFFKILELIKHSFSSSDATPQGKPLPKFELLSIAVDSNERRAGVAQRLYCRLKEYSTGHKIEAFRIVVGADLASAHKFYLRMGAVPVTEVNIHENKTSLIYVQSV